jgi:uncharacterized membrane protein YqgA involved in biofilm formation
MVRSDASGRDAPSRRLGGQTLRADAGPKAASLGTLESVLRAVAVGSGVSLVAVALWQVAAETSLAALSALLGSETSRWVAVAVFGGVLVLAATLSRVDDGR